MAVQENNGSLILMMFRGHYTFNSDVLTFYELSGELMRPSTVVGENSPSSQSSMVDSSVNLEITKVLKKLSIYNPKFTVAKILSVFV